MDHDYYIHIDCNRLGYTEINYVPAFQEYEFELQCTIPNSDGTDGTDGGLYTIPMTNIFKHVEDMHCVVYEGELED